MLHCNIKYRLAKYYFFYSQISLNKAINGHSDSGYDFTMSIDCSWIGRTCGKIL